MPSPSDTDGFFVERYIRTTGEDRKYAGCYIEPVANSARRITTPTIKPLRAKTPRPPVAVVMASVPVYRAQRNQRAREWHARQRAARQRENSTEFVERVDRNDRERASDTDHRDRSKTYRRAQYAKNIASRRAYQREHQREDLGRRFPSATKRALDHKRGEWERQGKRCALSVCLGTDSGICNLPYPKISTHALAFDHMLSVAWLASSFGVVEDRQAIGVVGNIWLAYQATNAGKCDTLLIEFVRRETGDALKVEAARARCLDSAHAIVETMARHYPKRERGAEPR